MLVYPVTEGFAAEIGDVDLARPLDAAALASIGKAFDRYSVLVFPDQHLSAGQHLAFAGLFGPLEHEPLAANRPRLRLRPEFCDVSNLDADGNIFGERNPGRASRGGNRLWHTDSSFQRVPARASFLYGREIPPVGGLTEFADLRAAYDALPAAKKAQLEGLVAEHSLLYSRAKVGFTRFSEDERRKLAPARQLLVRTHPGSGRRTLYLASHAARVVGMPDEAGLALLDELMRHATQRQFVYVHRWRANDLLMWDNRCTMHRGTAFDDLRWRRDMRRATVSDELPTCERERSLAAPVEAL